MPRWAKITAAVAAALIILVYVIPFLYPWTRLHCWYEDMDITCGRYRYQRYILWLKVSERVEETEVSKLWRELVGEPPEPSWHRVNTFSPGSDSSPHYVYHSGLHITKTMLDTFEIREFTPGAKRKVLVTVFRLLQEDGSDTRAKEYVIRLLKSLPSERDKNIPVGEEDLLEPGAARIRAPGG